MFGGSRTFMVTLAVATALVCFFSNPHPSGYYDYTFRVAGRLLEGHVALAEQPPSWLNEFVPFEGGWYSVFPLGSVVTMAPIALLKAIGLISEMPAAYIYAFIAGVCCLLMMLIAGRYSITREQQILLTLAILLGTFTWTNLVFGGAWQLALGFAMLGELGAIWFTVYDRRPLVAGLFFAMAFGNRTEILLTAPIFLYLLNRQTEEKEGKKNKKKKRTGSADVAPTDGKVVSHFSLGENDYRRTLAFCAVPMILGLATLAYNYARFHAISDFGNSRIPGVLNEPWYNHGIFSVYYIPRQAWEMLLRLWETRPTFPYIAPNPFSSSIILSSPFFLFVFRRGSRDRTLKVCAWLAVLIMTLLLWMHGNSGGFQFGYRYAMILLPWVFVILLENAPKKISPLEYAAYVFSFMANAYATWLFYWTSYMK
jgi:hypothetical protein